MHRLRVPVKQAVRSVSRDNKNFGVSKVAFATFSRRVDEQQVPVRSSILAWVRGRLLVFEISPASTFVDVRIKDTDRLSMKRLISPAVS